MNYRNSNDGHFSPGSHKGVPLQHRNNQSRHPESWLILQSKESSPPWLVETGFRQYRRGFFKTPIEYSPRALISFQFSDNSYQLRLRRYSELFTEN